MRKLLFAFGLLILLSGCSSTGVITTSEDTYMISKQSAAGIFGTAGGVTADIFTEANQHCNNLGKSVKTVNLDVKEAKPFVRTGSATLYFKCISKQ